MIDLKRDKKDREHSDRIQSIVTKDGTKHEFVTPPIVSYDGYIGYEIFRSLSIPLTEVWQFYREDRKDEMQPNIVQCIITKDGTKYEFDTPPTFANGAYVGAAVKTLVSIPLSDVSEVYTTKFDLVGTAFLTLAVVALVVVVLMGTAARGYQETVLGIL